MASNYHVESCLEPDQRRNRHDSVVAINPLRTKRDGTCKERSEQMPPQQKTRDLARSLVASEAKAATTSLQPEPATVRVYERLRRQLGAPVGVDGFHSLASRALALAKSESPKLSAVQVTVKGGLHGLDEVESQRIWMRMARPE